jgi:hypothetical protein
MVNTHTTPPITTVITLISILTECGVEKKIQCKLCFKKFRRKWNLEQHQKRIHRKHFKDDQPTVIRYANESDLEKSVGEEEDEEPEPNEKSND